MPWSADGQTWTDPANAFLNIPRACPGCSLETFDARTTQAVPCNEHGGETRGEEDERVTTRGTLSGVAEAGDATNRAVCDFLHRGVESEVKEDPKYYGTSWGHVEG